MKTYKPICQLIWLIAMCCCPLFTIAQTFTVTIPQQIRNTAADRAFGIGTNWARDGEMTLQDLRKINPKTMRWGEGALGNRIAFNKDNPSEVKLQVQDPTLGWLNYFSKVSPDWTVSAGYDIDKFVAQCKSLNAEPVVIIGLYGLQYDGSYPKMTKEEIYSAAEEFVRYCNITKGYNIKYWEIGNENDLGDERMTGNEYGNIFNEIVPRMKAVDPSIHCGANSFDNNGEWDIMLPIIKDNVDFLITHTYVWLGDEDGRDGYLEFIDHLYWDWNGPTTRAREALAKHPAIPKKLFITELSSLAPRNDGNTTVTNTFKALLNINKMMANLSFPEVEGAHFWTTIWSDNLKNSIFNLYNTDYSLTSQGLSMSFIENALYNNLGEVQTNNQVEMWISHNNQRNKVSVYLNNYTESDKTVTVDLKGHNITDWRNNKWVLKGSAWNSTDVTLTEVASQEVGSGTFDVFLPKLSATSIDFYAGTNEITTLTAPAPIRQGSTINLSVDYQAAQQSDVYVVLQDLNTGTGAAFARKTVPAGIGTVDLSVVVNEAAAVHTNYQWNSVLTTVGGSWEDRLDNFIIRNVNVTAAEDLLLIGNKATGRYLRPATNQLNATIQVADNDGSDWFKWEKVSSDNGFFYLKNKQTDMYFRPENEQDGSLILQKPTDWNGTWTQWEEVSSGDGATFHLKNRATGKHIRPAGNSNPSNLQLLSNIWTGDWTRWSMQPSSQSQVVTVNARGISGEEQLQLQSGGQVLAEWSLTTAMQEYTTTITRQTGNLKLAFINDATGRNVQIDYLSTDNVTFQAEDQSINTGGWNLSTSACGGAQSEWLHCNGFIEFNAEVANTSQSQVTSVESRSSEVALYPNPVKAGENLTLHIPESGYQNVNIYDLSGHLVQHQPILDGNNQLSITLDARLTQGLYLLKLSGKKNTTTRKILIE